MQGMKLCDFFWVVLRSLVKGDDEGSERVGGEDDTITGVELLFLFLG